MRNVGLLVLVGALFIFFGLYKGSQKKDLPTQSEPAREFQNEIARVDQVKAPSTLPTIKKTYSMVTPQRQTPNGQIKMKVNLTSIDSV